MRASTLIFVLLATASAACSPSADPLTGKWCDVTGCMRFYETEPGEFVVIAHRPDEWAALVPSKDRGPAVRRVGPGRYHSDAAPGPSGAAMDWDPLEYTLDGDVLLLGKRESVAAAKPIALTRTPVRSAAIAQTAELPDADQDARAIREAFVAYRRAVLTRDGGSAAGSVSLSTLDRFRRIRGWALRATRDELKRLSLLDQIAVLATREQLGRALNDMTPRDVFAHSVEKGWVRDAELLHDLLLLDVGSVKVGGDTAVAVVTIDGHPEEEFAFVKESGSWRLDLVPLIERSDRLVRLSAIMAGGSGDDAVELLVAELIGREVRAWEPLL